MLTGAGLGGDGAARTVLTGLCGVERIRATLLRFRFFAR